MLAITICATESYTYAMRAQARRVIANLDLAGIKPPDAHIVLIGDDSKAIKAVAKAYEVMLPPGFPVTLINDPTFKEGGANYKEQAQLLIAAMRQAAFTFARKIGANMVWSLDSDTLPPDNALRCMLHMLEFDGGYYSISTCTYPNTGFLGGFGTPQNPIAEDFLPHERKLSPRLKLCHDTCEKRLKEAKDQKVADKEQKRMQRLRERIKKCPPDGNVFTLNGKFGYRRRGWMDQAYPGIGRGSVVPTDWCGFGCTLMNKRALTSAHFDGYDGKGTEDLFIVWRRWHQAGLRLNLIAHCPCDHVIWEKKKGGDAGKYVMHSSYHETDGECAGHLRTRQTPWVPETI